MLRCPGLLSSILGELYSGKSNDNRVIETYHKVITRYNSTAFPITRYNRTREL